MKPFAKENQISIVIKTSSVWGFPGYFINTNGVVFGKKGNPLKPFLVGRGYPCVHLRLPDGTVRSKLVHRLVALTFINNPHDLPIVHHLNRDISDPSAKNLEWRTQKENIADVILAGNRYQPIVYGSRNGRSKLTENMVHRIRKLYLAGWSENKLITKFNVSQSTINKILLWKTWKHC
jgi:hypothetical protein